MRSKHLKTKMNIEEISYRISNRGVPHVLIVVDGIQYSVCYFGRLKQIKIWNFKTQEKLGAWPIAPGEELDIIDTIRQCREQNEGKL